MRRYDEVIDERGGMLVFYLFAQQLEAFAAHQPELVGFLDRVVFFYI